MFNVANQWTLEYKHSCVSGSTSVGCHEAVVVSAALRFLVEHASCTPCIHGVNPEHTTENTEHMTEVH